ncbi:anaerobic ribonucleoside-triphosphate reductase activating protein [Methanosphaerula palustris]|uniref:Anaerobic ribonucleoside-triphosphate reductase activating protein n=1 Tax=Methanosphaerula palustris (strain ATCC BAA-1556 / DSM 19958 / E1-9c) TaxID=521011 RepID=B8GKY3_METPE|nr:anaerobic ribonucleoside-triphosphate reductase activating protein [Methanosphaerula palustris]ACL17279.1 anaerobic ribonucleoside-triphosphate reductase activating protein [Methanosphaerula palustris E1-9c]
MNGDALKVNFGGFVPLSTVDWPGRAVCTVFFRGCPVRCPYCQNRAILGGTDLREVSEVRSMISSSGFLISGVVFSGGEATAQVEPLAALAAAAHDLGLATGVQTNGVYPAALAYLIENELVDRVALDIKARWERYPNLFGVDLVAEVQQSLELCRSAHLEGRLEEFEVVITLFPGYEGDVQYIASTVGGVDLVLQQGVQGRLAPLTDRELQRVADQIGRRVRIRTRTGGEYWYEGNRDRWFAGER